jgi:o-succinylbenzoate---CoA ligase
MVKLLDEKFPKPKTSLFTNWHLDLIHWIETESSPLGKMAFSYFQRLENSKNPPTLLLSEPDPVRFLAGLIAAVATDSPVFLGNPHWVSRDWEAAIQQIQPSRIWYNGQDIPGTTRGQTSPPVVPGGIMIPTGGSSGKIRFVVHTWETLIASVTGFVEYFQLSTVNSFCVLPLFHVSGLMQFLRSFTTGGKFLNFSSYQDILDLSVTSINPESFFISLVPTQLNRLLQNSTSAHYLSRFKTVLLGGAPAWSDLLERARKYEIPLSPTYGMTETASQIATLKPGEFLAGNQSCGRLLPHATLTITGSTGLELKSGQTGLITIQAKSLAKGYYPPDLSLSFNPSLNSFQSDDLGFIDEAGYLTVVGRRGEKIISGGENIYPAEVEAAILRTGWVQDVCVIAIPDRDWGQVVTAVYVPVGTVQSEAIVSSLSDQLAPFKRPKHWVQVDSLPRNHQGKILRSRVQEMVIGQLNSPVSSQAEIHPK